MGAAIDALEDSWIALNSNPSLLAISALLVFVGGIAATFGGLLSLFIPFVGNFLINPFIAALFAGLIGATYTAAQDGSGVSFSDYESALSDAGFDVFLASVVKQLIYLGLWLGIVLILFILALFGAGISSPEQAGAASAGILVVAGLALGGGFLIYLSLAFVLQFVNAAIVIDGDSIIESFKTSFHVVRNNPVSATGYALLRFTIGTALWLLVAPLAILGNVIAGETVALLATIVGLILIAPVAAAWFYVYHAHYYKRIRQNAM